MCHGNEGGCKDLGVVQVEDPDGEDCFDWVFCENARSAGPVFPQLGLEPNHAGLASQSLFLLEEFLCRVKRSGTLNILKLLKLFKKSSKLS